MSACFVGAVMLTLGQRAERGRQALRPQRLVLEALRETRPHLSTDDRVDALDAPLARGSDYNVMGALSTRGLPMVTDVDPGRALYEPAGGLAPSLRLPLLRPDRGCPAPCRIETVLGT